MWKLATVSPNLVSINKQTGLVTIYEPTGTQRQEYKTFEEAVCAMLAEGWEPFERSNSLKFRKRIS